MLYLDKESKNQTALRNGNSLLRQKFLSKNYNCENVNRNEAASRNA